MNWIWLNKTFIQVKLSFIFWIVYPNDFILQWWQLNGFSQMRILSCTLKLQGLTEQNDSTSWLDSTSGWIIDLNGIVYIHASEQQIIIKMRTTKSLKNLRIFCPLLGTVHYWELLLNKNGWEAGFCPLLGSTLLGEYSVIPKTRNGVLVALQRKEYSNHSECMRLEWEIFSCSQKKLF